MAGPVGRQQGERGSPRDDAGGRLQHLVAVSGDLGVKGGRQRRLRGQDGHTALVARPRLFRALLQVGAFLAQLRGRRAGPCRPGIEAMRKPQAKAMLRWGQGGAPCGPRARAPGPRCNDSTARPGESPF